MRTELVIKITFGLSLVSAVLLCIYFPGRRRRIESCTDIQSGLLLFSVLNLALFILKYPASLDLLIFSITPAFLFFISFLLFLRNKSEAGNIFLQLKVITQRAVSKPQSWFFLLSVTLFLFVWKL
jgi:hypothetical protein